MQIRIFLHFILWSLVFLQGSIQVLSIPSVVYKVGIPITVILLLSITAPKKIKRMPYLGHIFLIFILSLFSFVINSISFFNFIYFILYVTLPYFYFVVALNEPNEKVIKQIKKIITFYVLLQIPVVIYSFVLYICVL